MNLVLEATSAHADVVERSSRKTFTEAGGTIGRGPGDRGVNHWVLQHQFVSGLHAKISYANGVFYIEDLRSINGIYVNGAEQRLEEGRRCALKPGDSIFIDPFRILVSISGEQQVASSWSSRELFGSPLDPDSLGARGPEVIGGLFGPERAAPPAPVKSDSNPNRNSFLNHQMRAPQIVRVDPPPAVESPAIPDGYNPAKTDLLSPVSSLRPGPSPEPNVTPPSPTPSPSPLPAWRGGEKPVRHVAEVPATPAAQSSSPPPESGIVGLSAMLGLGNVPVAPELEKNIGEIFRTVIQGVLDVLDSRRDVKNEIGVEHTQFGQRKNNPLKYSTDVDDALHNLFVRRNPGYLGPVEAFEDAFDDLRHHQVAMLAGVRATFDAMLAEFEPKRLEETFERRKKDSMVPMPNRFRYWDHYRERFEDMVKDADATVSRLFREQFASAYEAQLEELRARRRARKP